MADVSNPSHWNERYKQGSTPWNLEDAAPALKQLLAELPSLPKRKVLVPGAGHGHDALAWAQAGHDVVAVDFACHAVTSAQNLAAAYDAPMRVVQSDLFDLPADLRGAFDVVWEQTCLCAIDPDRQPEYVEAMWQALEPGGTMYALLWNHGNEGGPPFNLPPDYAKTLLGKRFELVSERTSTDSSRNGEYLLALRRL